MIATPSRTSISAHVAVRFGSQAPVVYALEGQVATIGSGPGCDIVVSGLPPVACRLEPVDELYRVQRVDSDFPIFWNSLALKTEAQLQNGDQLQIGDAQFHFQFEKAHYLRPQFVSFRGMVEQSPAEAEFRDRVHRFEAELTRRQVELDERERNLAEIIKGAVAERLKELEAEYQNRLPVVVDEERHALQSERDRYVEQLVRIDRREALLEGRRRELDARAVEIDQRHERLTRESIELEEHLRLSTAEEERISAESARLDKLRGELEERAEILARESSRLESQQAMLAVLRARLDRREDDSRREAARIATERARIDDVGRDLAAKLREAERLRTELLGVRDDHSERQRLVEERELLLQTTLDELRAQEEQLRERREECARRETELDARSADLADQTAKIKSRAEQFFELQNRLESERDSLRTREEVLSENDAARQTFQEVLRRRQEELATRSRQLEDDLRKLGERKTEFETRVARWEAQKDDALAQAALSSVATDSRSQELERRALELAAREEGILRKTTQLRTLGRILAAGRKTAFLDRRRLEVDRSTLAERWELLRREAPELEARSRVVVERLALARESIRGQLGELHDYAGTTKQELDQLRDALKRQAESVQDRERNLDKARDEHRLSVADFRRRMTEWQAVISEMKQSIARGEERMEEERAEAREATRRADETTIELVRREEELRREQRFVAERREEVERHLGDLREWYRRKLRDLAGESTSETAAPLAAVELATLDPGDRRLGELLRAYGLVDAETLDSLWKEVERRHKPLRSVLMQGGAITVYQLSQIESGNVAGLMLGRFRIVDRLRTNERETWYRVFDPARASSPTRGLYLLRQLNENEMEDALHPDEFRQMFGLAATIDHPGIAPVLETLELDGRPAVLCDWLGGVPSTEWPEAAAVPGVWLRLLHGAASALTAAHHAGICHGRLTTGSFVLTEGGTVQILGFGEPSWLASESALDEATPDGDLRALGAAAYLWSRLDLSRATPKRRSRRGLPDSLTAVLRRLEADPETPMSDTTIGVSRYASADDLVRDLARLATLFPAPPESWETLLRHVTDNTTDAPSQGTSLRKTA